MAFTGNVGPVHDDLGRVIAPHGVDRQGEMLRHVPRAPALSPNNLRCGRRP